MSVQAPPKVGTRSGHIGGAEAGECLRRIVEATPDAIVTLDATGKVVQLNCAAEELLGYGRNELVGEVFGELLVPEALRTDFWSALLSVVSGEERAPDQGFAKLRAMRRGGEELAAALVTARTSDSPLLITIFLRAPGLGFPAGGRDQAEPPRLSDRERQVLALASEGLSGPEIAAELIVSPATVKSHFQNIYEKLAVTNRGAAVAKAMRLGVIS